MSSSLRSVIDFGAPRAAGADRDKPDRSRDDKAGAA
jgi:hypothetical protein